MPHTVIETFLWLLGLCVGSFLNVVVYRLPRGLSISDPVRSFCPRCRAGIAWYDNLPILNWIVLRGRCRHCGVHISVQYPLVEALTGLSFVLVYHLLFVVPSRVGLAPPLGPADFPLLLAWLILIAGLIACSAMDIVSYTVDVRITNLALGAAVVLHALWPRSAFLEPRADNATAAAALAAFVVSGLMLWWTVWRAEEDEPPPESAEDVADGPSLAETRGVRFGGQLGVLVFLGSTAWLIQAGFAGDAPGISATVVPAALLAIFVATVLIGGQQRPADEEIKAAIEEEQPLARRTALKELAWLTPAIVAAAAIWLCVWFDVGGGGALWSRLVSWSPGRDFAPVAGAAYAIQGAIIAAAAGWALRILFTLALGREAFGVGDIYILAAAGAATGWDIAVLGLLLSVAVALAGWLVGLLLKSTVMIPFGPWLALGFLLALWWHEPAARIADIYRAHLAIAWRERPELLAVIAGLMLAGTGGALALARLMRHWVESRQEVNSSTSDH